MRTSTSSTAILALASIATAVPHHKRQNACIVNTVMDPNTNQIMDSIIQWSTDVNTVNAFLNSAADLINDADALQSQAMLAFMNAQDEPCQLATLMSIPGIGVDAFECAVTELMQVFGPQVLDNLMKIINAPGDTASVQTAVDDINQIRCCAVLPDASIMWLDAADDAGISDQVPTAAKREKACASITCTPKCSGLDNGPNGK